MMPPMQDTVPFTRWLREGLRAGVLLPARVEGQPRPWHLVALLVLLTAVELGLGRLEVSGPAGFSFRAWLAPWWATAALVLLAWAMFPGQVARWFTLWTAALLLPTTASLLLGIAQSRSALPPVLKTEWAGWAVYLALWAWTVAIGVQLARGLHARGWRPAALALALVLLLGSTAWIFPERPWYPDESLAQGEEAPRLQLSQETFEAQQAAWDQAVAGLAAQRPGVVDVYGLVFAPYAEEDVFLRESTLVAGVLAERFDAAGRVLHLVNHATTATSHPWATPLNLERAVQALAGRMDPGEDLLVVYLTSHGASDHKLAASHGPLAVGPVSPGELRVALDKAGVRHRVIAVSACYSGGWVAPLANEHTLVMTAADATHTSYGCGKLSELTFFGRALFDEQLRKTHSFEQAFAAAVPVIAQREQEAGKSDGFSNPQISVGEAIRPLLRQLEQRLQSRP